MRMSYLETLLAVHRFGSFSRAAESRNMTLSALSMQMKTLEEDLNVALFDRTFRPPKLTPIGEKIALDAKAVIEAEARLRSHCTTTALNGQFHVGFVTSLAARSLSEFLRLAAQQVPNACFSFETGLSEVLCEGVRTGRLDAALVTEISEATAGLIANRLFTEEMVFVTPSHVKRLTYQKLARELPFFHFLPNSGIGRLIARFCDDHDVRPTQSIYLDNIEAIINCVSNGLGYSLLPKEEVQRYGYSRVNAFSCTPELFFRTISLVTRPDPLSEIWRDSLLTLARASVAVRQ